MDVGGLEGPGGREFCERQVGLVGGAGLAFDLQPAPHQRRGAIFATLPRPPLLTGPLPFARTPCGVPGLLGLGAGGGAATFGEPDLSQVGVGRGAQPSVVDLPAEQHGGPAVSPSWRMQRFACGPV